MTHHFEEGHYLRVRPLPGRNRGTKRFYLGEYFSNSSVETQAKACGYRILGMGRKYSEYEDKFVGVQEGEAERGQTVLADEVEGCLKFVVGGVAAEGEAKGKLDLAGGVGCAGLQAMSKVGRLVADKGGV